MKMKVTSGHAGRCECDGLGIMDYRRPQQQGSPQGVRGFVQVGRLAGGGRARLRRQDQGLIRRRRVKHFERRAVARRLLLTQTISGISLNRS